MKSSKKCPLLFIFIIFRLLSNSQNFICYTNDSLHINSNTTQNSDCLNYNNYIPSISQSVKIVKVNIHVMQQSMNNPQNFPDNVQARNAIASLIGSINGNDGINYIFRNIEFPISGGVPGGAYIQNSKIQFDLTNIYYHVDPIGFTNNNQNCGTYNILNHGINIDSEINIFLCQNFSPNQGGCSQFPGGTLFINMFKIADSYLQQPFNYFPTWASEVQLLAHEIGHNLGLQHTFQPDLFNDTPYPGGNNFCDANTVTGCTNNLMSYSNTKKWISPQQVSYAHYTLSNLSRKYLTTCELNNNNNTIINSNEIWLKTEVIQGDLIVNSGTVLTIKCKVYFNSHSKVIVEQGGKLIVDGGELTTECPSLWQGIKVYGDITKGQFTTDPQGHMYQGMVELKNGAVIENAKVGIEAWKLGTWVNGGGVVRIDNATIRNCRVGVHFGLYNNFLSASYIKNTHFETTDNLLGGILPYAFIDGWQIRGLKIFGNTFRNTNANALALNQLGKGIYLESAGAVIHGLTNNNNEIDFCNENDPNWQPNIFENLHKGIELINFGMLQTNGLYSSQVWKNVFKNCIYAIEVNGLPAVSIVQNKIILGNNPVQHTYNEGIVYRSNTGFTITENCISQIGTNADFTGGIIVNHSGGDNNEVYKNKSFDVEHAFMANGQNKSNTQTERKFKGLQFLCNENYGNQKYDFVVENDNYGYNDPLMGIRYYQGGDGSSLNPTPAGNKFTNLCQTPESDFYNNTINPIVYFHGNAPFETPICYSWNVSSSALLNNAECLSKIGITIGEPESRQIIKNQLESAFAIKNTQYIAASVLYFNLIDNGSSQNLLQSIPNYNQSIDLRNFLLSNSPNLSDEVIMQVVQQNTFLQNSDILAVIAANPDVAHNEVLLDMLREKTNPMDEWMIEFLREAGTNLTNRTFIERTFAQKQYERDALVWQMVQFLLTDTVNETVNSAELHAWLNILNTPRAKYLIAEDFAAKADFVNAQTTLNSIDENKLNSIEKSELNGMKAILSFHHQLYIQNKTIFQLDSIALDSLRPYETNLTQYGVAGMYASNILRKYEPEEYSLLPNVYPQNTQAKNAAKKKPRVLKYPKKDMEKSNDDFTIFPNPANEIVYLSALSNEMVMIQIYTLEGKLMLTQAVTSANHFINTNALSTGTYQIQILDKNNKILKQKKLIISKNQ